REPVVVIHPLVAEPEVVHREELGAPEAELRLPRLELEGEAEGLVHAVDVLVPLGEALPRVDRLRLGDREGRLALWTERGLDQAELTVPPEHREVRVPSLSIAPPEVPDDPHQGVAGGAVRGALVAPLPH